MTTTIRIRPTLAQGYSRERLTVAAGAAVGGLVLLAFANAVVVGRPLMGVSHDGWLALHLVSVIPAVPLGAFVLLRRKGDRMHRMLGWLWGLMMITAALSSFGLHGLTGRLSWIHILSVVVVVMVPRGIWQAIRHDVVAHRRTMTMTYLGLVGAGLFTFLPGRLLGYWLVG